MTAVADLLARGLDELGLNSVGLGPLLRYLEELESWNPKFGFVNTSGPDLVVRHVLDSLAALPSLAARDPRRLADIGSGAGFPGLPLALYLDGCECTLVEPQAKRAAFLRTSVALLGLAHVRVLDTDLEALAARRKEAFDIVTFRAFRGLDGPLVRRLSVLLSPRGCIAAYKGRRRQVDAELTAAADVIRSLRFEADVRPLTVPFLAEERNLVLLTRSASA